MPTIKINEWTKEQLEEIKEDEEHSSFDSVVKSLIYRLYEEDDVNA
ncbi:hypothetical protein PNP83_11140 [Halobacterium salinarum]|nr:hypothetical protein [Halobacterium salinarum]